MAFEAPRRQIHDKLTRFAAAAGNVHMQVHEARRHDAAAGIEAIHAQMQVPDRLRFLV